MTETLEVARSVRAETRTVLNLGIYMKKTSELGAERLKDRFKVAGISRATQHRWISGGSVPDMDLARKVAKRLGVPLNELFVEVAA